jgi:hypothetical protein
LAFSPEAAEPCGAQRTFNATSKGNDNETTDGFFQ